MTIERYLEHRRRWELLIAIALLLVSLAANTGTVWMELARGGRDFPAWVPFVLEGSSHIGLALIVPLVIWFDTRFPIRAGQWQSSVPAHALFSVIVSFLHVLVMYSLRVFTYGVLMPANPYHWDNWLREFFYEYLIDFRSYMLILALLYLYRFIIRRLQGEAGFVSDDQDADQPMSDRFLIKKLGREFLVQTRDVDWIESSGNYVNLHVGNRVYPLRETMTNISDRLSPLGFQRIHRSAIVNLDRVTEMTTFDSGDGEARLRDDVTVPISRRYRKALRQRIG